MVEKYKVAFFNPLTNDQGWAVVYDLTFEFPPM